MRPQVDAEWARTEELSKQKKLFSKLINMSVLSTSHYDNKNKHLTWITYQWRCVSVWRHLISKIVQWPISGTIWDSTKNVVRKKKSASNNSTKKWFKQNLWDHCGGQVIVLMSNGYFRFLGYTVTVHCTIIFQSWHVLIYVLMCCS